MKIVLHFFFFDLQRTHKSYDTRTVRGLLFFAPDDRYPEQQSSLPNFAFWNSLGGGVFA
jgi:hypothetical protein